MNDSFAIAFVVGLIIAGIAALVSLMNRHSAEESATDKITKRGLQQSIIKQASARLYIDSLSMPQGVIALTWDSLFFFGNQQDCEIPIVSIRSTSSEHKSAGTNMIVLADSGTFRFYWEDEKRTVPGILSMGGVFGVGMGISRSANPNVSEWIQLIDDLRFGRLTKPATANPAPPPIAKPIPPPLRPPAPPSPEQATQEHINKSVGRSILGIIILTILGCCLAIWSRSSNINQSTVSFETSPSFAAYNASKEFVDKKVNISIRGAYTPYGDP